MAKIALVHDHLLEFGGAERVLVALKKIYPDADVYTAFLERDNLGIGKEAIADWDIRTSWADKVPGLKRLYSPLRFLGPYIWESLDFAGYDIVISSSATLMSKGIITRPETLHISYLHHPPRYLYYYETAMEWQKYWPIRVYGHFINHGLRQYDYLSSQRVDYFIANSEETRRRIRKVYRRDSCVIYPPVVIPEQAPVRSADVQANGYYLTVSRLARAKHIDILVEASKLNGFKLKIIGSGRDLQRLQALAGPHVEFHGGVSDSEREALYAGAKGFLFASVDEEFGIAPVEALGFGVPVIAYASGGLKETVTDGVNGFLYRTLSPDALVAAIERLESLSQQEYATMCRNSRTAAERYSHTEFARHFSSFVEEKRAELDSRLVGNTS
ncbi:MAG: glycosyltransferase [Patescibacteria group bacterium]|nr:glycosyltransferase [Patescibacteria group bacterium]